MTPDQYCEQKTARSGSTFHYSVLFVRPPQRGALTALHALGRELKQVVEATADENASRIKLAWWRNEIDALFKGQPQHLVTRALLPRLAASGMAQAQLEAMVDGAEMDLMQTRYLDFPALEAYCSHTGGAAMQCAFRLCSTSATAPTEQAAHEIGTALRLISLIRNAGQHARLGRVYLPVSELQQFQVPVADLLNAGYSDNFRQLMEFQGARAQARLSAGIARLPVSDRKAQRPALITAAIYRALLDEIGADGFQVLHQRAALTPIRKFWLAWKTQVTA